mmetsp:Transcript_27711/g.61842  ORF Transcript_27711/g.61842 Transcript_27711/m.61842 type:complete len:251 (-) Transcript_27711:231-983(-)
MMRPVSPRASRTRHRSFTGLPVSMFVTAPPLPLRPLRPGSAVFMLESSSVAPQSSTACSRDQTLTTLESQVMTRRSGWAVPSPLWKASCVIGRPFWCSLTQSGLELRRSYSKAWAVEVPTPRVRPSVSKESAVASAPPNEDAIDLASLLRRVAARPGTRSRLARRPRLRGSQKSTSPDSHAAAMRPCIGLMSSLFTPKPAGQLRGLLNRPSARSRRYTSSPEAATSSSQLGRWYCRDRPKVGTRAAKWRP